MSVQFETRPVRGSRGPNRAMLLALGLVAFVVVAIVKPWESSRPDAPRPAAAAVATPTPALLPSAAPTAAPIAIAPTQRPGVEDWTQDLTFLLRDHGPEVARQVSLGSQLGLRTITWKGTFAGTRIPTQPLDGSLLEWWYPAPDGGRSTWDSLAIQVVQPAPRAPVLALGITTQAGDAALDVRFWRRTAGGLERLAAIDVTGPTAANRLFLPPFVESPSGGWPEGDYVAEMLLGSGTLAIPFTIGAGGGQAVPRSEPGGAPPRLAAIAAAVAAAPGAFVVGGSAGVEVQPATAIARMDSLQAWLAAGDPITEGPPRLARFRESAPIALGVSLPPGSVLQAATLWGISPVTEQLDANRLVNPVDAAVPFVAFARDGFAPWPAGTYGITARFWDAAYQFTEQTWHLDIGINPSTPVPILLGGAGRWASTVDEWAVLSTVGSAGTNRTVGEPLTYARSPETSPMLPELMGTACPGSAHVDRASRLIGVAFPPDAGVTAVSLVRRFSDGVSSPQRVAAAILPATGLALFAAPADTHGTWAEGYYDVLIALSPGPPLYLPMCIGRDAGSSYLFRVELSAAAHPGRSAAHRAEPTAAYAGPGGVMASGAMLKP